MSPESVLTVPLIMYQSIASIPPLGLDHSLLPPTLLVHPFLLLPLTQRFSQWGAPEGCWRWRSWSLSPPLPFLQVSSAWLSQLLQGNTSLFLSSSKFWWLPLPLLLQGLGMLLLAPGYHSELYWFPVCSGSPTLSKVWLFATSGTVAR